jgi:hypothetical protein
MFLNAASGGCAVFQAGVGWDFYPIDGRTQERQRAIGQSIVTVVRSFTEYLGCTVKRKNIPLSLQEKITELDSVLETRHRRLCIQGNCVLYGIRDGFKSICDDRNGVFSHYTGCSVRDVPGALCIPIKKDGVCRNTVEAGTGEGEQALEAVAKQIADDILENVRQRVSSAPSTDRSLEEAVRGILTKIRTGFLNLVLLVVFLGRGIRLSACFERTPVENNPRQACVWSSTEYGSSLDWLADKSLCDEWKTQEPFRICGSAQCLSLSTEENALKHFGTVRRPYDIC